MATKPSKKLLAQIRRHVGRINSSTHFAVAALDDASRPLEEVIATVSELAHATTNQADNTVTALLLASHDRRPEVREAAAKAMAVHPYGLIRDRLCELADDPITSVRAAAAKAAAELAGVTPPEEEEPRPRSKAKIGHTSTAHVRLKGVRLENTVTTDNVMIGDMPEGWTRAYLLSYRADGRARFVVLEPSTNPDEGWSFRGFFVTGARVVELENQPKAARARFDAIPSLPKGPKVIDDHLEKPTP